MLRRLRLDLDPDRVDVIRFRQLVDQGRRADRSAEHRAALLGQALELWRGVPLADLHSQWVVRVRHGWLQQQLEALATWSLACLRAGDPGRALPRLAESVAEHPTAESLQAVYMQALCALARPAAHHAG